MAPPAQPRLADQRGPRGGEASPTFVFQNGETGERQVFRGSSRDDQDSANRLAAREPDMPEPRFPPPPRYDFPPRVEAPSDSVPEAPPPDDRATRSDMEMMVP